MTNIALIITDGKSSKDFERTIPEATLAKESGIEIYAIGVTAAVDMVELYNIASSPSSSHVFNVTTYETLGTALSYFISQACFNYGTTVPMTTVTGPTVTSPLTSPSGPGSTTPQSTTAPISSTPQISTSTTSAVTTAPATTATSSPIPDPGRFIWVF